MNEEMYLIDNNALSHLSLAQRASEFFHTRCRIPSEVLHEAQGYPDSDALKAVEYPTTASVLRFLRTVMSTVAEDDTALVNLYANKGAADPILVACAMDAMQESASLLFGPTWAVVSNDKAVRAKAAELGVKSLTREEFISRTQHCWDSSSQPHPSIPAKETAVLGGFADYVKHQPHDVELRQQEPSRFRSVGEQ